jgi:hypothetical protein
MMRSNIFVRNAFQEADIFVTFVGILLTGNTNHLFFKKSALLVAYPIPDANCCKDD